MPKSVEIEVKKNKTKKNSVEKGKAIEVKNTAKKETKRKITSQKEDKEKLKKALKRIESKSAKSTKKETKPTKKVADSKPKKTETKETTKKNTKALQTIKSEKPVVKKPEFLQEYYDLPYRYNETIVTILAQTPRRLFVYWDISDKDKETYIKAFGEDFFEKTYPVLLVHNQDLNYTFEVPINDFANSWYLDIQDPRTNYVVQLGRKFKNIEQTKNININAVKQEHINLQNDFIYITDSNKLESPNDHILFELLSDKVKYRNVKDGTEFTKDLKNLVNGLSESYPNEAIYELYTKLYEDEIAREDFGRKNPASSELGLPTSSGAFRSSR